MRGRRKINSPTQPGFKQASPLKGGMVQAVADAGGLPSPDTKQSKIGVGRPNKRSHREGYVSRKRALSQDTGDASATKLKRPPTPINLFEDECVFCHSFRTTELFHGPMVHYLKGRVMPIDEGNSSNAIYVHKKCLEWAPKVWFDGDIIMNLESEIRRASRLRCKRCGLRGAALGCYDKHCRKSYHFPCAVQIIDCRWDLAKGYVLCPEHVSKTLPCDKLGTLRKENYSSSFLRQRHCSIKEEPFTNFEKEGQQSDLHKTTSSFFPVGHCADKEGYLDVRLRENKQSDQLNTSNTSLLPQSVFPPSQLCHKEGICPNSSRGDEQMDHLSINSCLPGGLCIKEEENLDNHQRENQGKNQFITSNPSHSPQSQHSQKEGISTNSSRDGQQIDELDTSSSCFFSLGQHSSDKGTSKNLERDNQGTHERMTSNLSLHQSSHRDEGISDAFQGKEIIADQPDTSICPSNQLVLFGLSLSVPEEDFLQKFACLAKVTLTKEWGTNVTHVIVGKGAGSSCSRSFEVLMAILLGRWVVHFEWVAGCLGTLPGPEDYYEVALSMDSARAIDGPKKGRLRATEGAPNLFSGLCFCLSAHMSPGNRDRMRDLIAAADGRVMEKRDLHLQLANKNPGGSLAKPYFVYDAEMPGEFSSSSLREEMEEAREQAAAGAQVVSHLRVLDAVAAYDAEVLDVEGSSTS